MCLILFAWRSHPRYALVLAANRDEFHERPSAEAAYWPGPEEWLGGRDLQAGGTWLGITRTMRFAAVTNFREPLAPEPSLGRSRGELVTAFLEDDRTPLEHLRAVQARGEDYRGFNLLAGTPDSLAWVSNRGGEACEVAPGCHGLSNHLLDTDWPKVRSGRKRLGKLLETDPVDAGLLLELLSDRGLTPGEMPAGADLVEVRRHLMNHYFIVSPVYGTRSSTVLLVDYDGHAEFVERRFGPDGRATGTSRFVL
ncbi:MAG: NRDE family protein [Lysobacterales bacterium]|jgi:uncharacterized protein with NRDE domain